MIDGMISRHVGADRETLRLKESEVMKGRPFFLFFVFVRVNCQRQRGIATDRSASLRSTCSVTFCMVLETL